jgi:hypothetical protein
VDEQNHQPLAFLSGAFKSASLRRSTTEKEAYAIVASCKRQDYLLCAQEALRYARTTGTSGTSLIKNRS